MWSWHILHPEAVTNGLVNNTRGIFWSNKGLYSNKSKFRLACVSFN